MSESSVGRGIFRRQALVAAATGLCVLAPAGCGGNQSSGTARDAKLSSLILSAGTLAPTFSAETTAYTAEVTFAESSMTVTPTAESAKATIKVEGVSVQSGMASQSISLALGSNEIAVLVTAEDGTTTRTYMVTVKRLEVDAGTWVEISPGTFTMGSPLAELGRYNDEVQHQVTLTRGFVMLSTEVTQGDFNTRMGYNPSTFNTCANCPVEMVNWHEAAAYCNALSTAAGIAACYTCTGTPPAVTCTPSTAYATPYACPGYRLPTEAEWEYAARAGTTTATYNHDNGDGNLTAMDCTDTALGPIAWFCGNAGSMTHVVGTKTANAWGLHDMLGNVLEWCQDWYGPYEGDVTDPTGRSTGSVGVIRGGAWDLGARYARAANRIGGTPGGARFNDLGLRPVRSLP